MCAEVHCRVCEENQPKYKCPKCRIPYCSVPCWKKHQMIDCVIPKIDQVAEKENEPQNTEYKYTTEDTVPLEKLELLRNDKDLRDLLSSPHLRDILKALDRSPNPSSSIQAAMMEPIFVEFADRCNFILDPPEKSEELLEL